MDHVSAKKLVFFSKETRPWPKGQIRAYAFLQAHNYVVHVGAWIYAFKPQLNAWNPKLKSFNHKIVYAYAHVYALHVRM